MDSHIFDGLFRGLITLGIVIGLMAAGVIWLLVHLVLYLVAHGNCPHCGGVLRTYCDECEGHE